MRRSTTSGAETEHQGVPSFSSCPYPNAAILETTQLWVNRWQRTYWGAAQVELPGNLNLGFKGELFMRRCLTAGTLLQNHRRRRQGKLLALESCWLLLVSSITFVAVDDSLISLLFLYLIWDYFPFLVFLIGSLDHWLKFLFFSNMSA